MKKRTRFGLITVTILLLFLTFSCNQGSQGRKLITSPDFALKDLQGNIVKLSDFKGKVVILNFWATWCPPCRKEIPDLIALSRTHTDDDLQILGISLDQISTEKLKLFVKTHGINYPILLGNRKVVKDFGGIVGVPTSFIIDKYGSIYRKYPGYQKRSIFEKAINTLLSQK